MLCILGDITSEPDCYERAWKLSRNRFGRAKRSLGLYYFRKGSHELCVEHFKDALAINPLNPQGWFVMGCSCMQLSQFEEALRAFSRAVTQERFWLHIFINIVRTLTMEKHGAIWVQYIYILENYPKRKLL